MAHAMVLCSIHSSGVRNSGSGVRGVHRSGVRVSPLSLLRPNLIAATCMEGWLSYCRWNCHIFGGNPVCACFAAIMASLSAEQ